MTEAKLIAIVGMAGRFPGARDIDQYWSNLRDGVESIRTLTDEQLIAAGVPRAHLADPSYVKVCPVLEDIDQFDAGFFGMSPREASVMDPAHRLFLQCTWEAVEHSGNACSPKDGKVAVFGGSGAPLYWANNLKTNADLMRSMGDFLVRHTGNDMNFLATRASYEFDFRGPSVNVQTACSSGLVAVHMAKESLLKGECDVAVAGAATVLVPMGQGYHYKEGEILSPDGHCRPFDRDSAGTVFGSGVGCVVLKRLEDALDAGDVIHAVIRGSAINNDGSVKVGYLAPGVDGQADVIQAALEDAGTSAVELGYVETHGTGTLVGDPIELTALQQAFGESGGNSCAIGSVKSNIGHLGEAAAMASLIKAVLALKHRQIPPTLGFNNPNPEFDFEASPFFVNDRLRPWEGSAPALCGITALGAGGTNCHLILQEAPQAQVGEESNSEQLLLLSAKSGAALKGMRHKLADFLDANTDVNLADVAYSLAVGRREFSHRHAVVAASVSEAASALRESDPYRGGGSQVEKPNCPVVFTFPGGGVQFAQMGRDLYEAEPVYREVMDECFEICEAELGQDLRGLLFPEPGAPLDPARSLTRPSLGLPALLATEIAGARLYESWGVFPEALLGHSMGECAAACFAGVMSLKDALRLIILRGRLFEKVDKGRMLGVCLPEAELRAIMPAGLDIAAANAPDLCVGSGPAELVEELQQILTDKEHEWTPIHIDVAAHSSMLEPILAQFRDLLKTLTLAPPEIPIVSNLTGTWLTDEQAVDPEYWTQHLRNTIRFSDCVRTLLEEGDQVFLEIGPGRAMTSLVKAQTEFKPRAVNSMRSFKETCGDLQHGLLALGRLWAEGAELERDVLYAEQLRYKLPLPTYAFDEQTFWVEPGKQTGPCATTTGDLQRIEDLDQWFSTMSWTPAPLAVSKPTSSQTWLVFTEDKGFIEKLRDTDRELHVIAVKPGRGLEQITANEWALNPVEPRQFVMLLERLAQAGITPDHLVYMWSGHSGLRASFVQRLRKQSSVDPYGNQLTWCYNAPVSVAKAAASCLEQAQLSFVSHGAFLIGDGSLNPMQSLLLGPALVVPREMPEISSRLIDLAGSAGIRASRQHSQLIGELIAETSDSVVALRPNARFVRSLSRMELPRAAAGADWARTAGAILITGGLGGLGLEVARHLAQAGPVKLALLSRTGLPKRVQWPAILSGKSKGSDAQLDRIQRVSELIELGADVCIVRADLSNEESLSAGLRDADESLGRIGGVIHCAGLLDDGPILSKTPEAMLRVLAPKVRGALLLDSLLGDTLDYFVAFSSVSSFLGLPGQVDYTAANAFLDAFAQERRMRCRGRTIVVNWNAWRDVGMIVRSQSNTALAPHPARSSSHPALDGYELDSAGQRWYATEFSVEGHWLLGEHQITGASAVMPGTGFLELARAAFCDTEGVGPLELSNVAFTSPFQVASRQARQLTLRLRKSGDTNAVVMSSELDSDPHMTAQIRSLKEAPPAALDLESIRLRCGDRMEPVDGFLDQNLVSFGPRWGNIVETLAGDGEALMELRLPPEFAGDLADFALHPALMDMATGGCQFLIKDFDSKEDFFVPMEYDRVRIFDGLSARIFSHVRCLPQTSNQFVVFDVTITDETGRVLVDVQRFTMVRLASGANILRATDERPEPLQQAKDGAFSALLENAITPTEGLAQLDRLMSQGDVTQVITSSVDLNNWLSVLSAETRRARGEEDPDESMVFSRPDLDTEFVEPEGRIEEALAKTWSGLLGVDQIGAEDNFFDLGGNSLTAVRLFTQVRRGFGLSLGIASLFEAPTIRSLASFLKQSGAVEDEPEDGAVVTPVNRWTPIVPLHRVGKKTPFFCAAGQGGNPMHMMELAKLIDPDRPFYGLQHRGMDEGSEPYGSVQEMAEDFLRSMQEIQPEGPYIVGGYSGGGTIAVEISRQLLKQKQSVQKVVLLDCFTPGVVGPSGPLEILRSVRYGFKRDGVGYLIKKVVGVGRSVARRLGLRSNFRTERAPVSMYERASTNWQVLESRYVPKAVNVPAVLLRSAPSNSEAGAHLDGRYDGWTDVITGGFDIVRTPGTHTTIYKEPNVQVLAAHIRDALQ